MAERSNGGRSLPAPPGPSRQGMPPTSSTAPDRDPPESHSHYPPPPPSDWDDRGPPPAAFHLPPMAAPTVTLPPIHGIYQHSYPPPSGPVNALVDARLAPSNYPASPTTANGQGTPPPGPQQQNGPYPQYNGPSPHGSAPGGGAPPPPQGPYADYYTMQQMQHRPSAYPPQNGYLPYPGYPAGYADYGQGGLAQIAPRQRTSIACRYCRKRKIRCSGYANTTNGKCTNCDKLKIDCIFQPVSSGVSQAFIPVSAIPGGVPPGTPLFGAYGQPLPPSGRGSSQNGYVIPPGYPRPPPQQHQQHHQQPLGSPTEQYAPQPEAPHGRRRPRESDEEDRNSRLPPPPAPDGYHSHYDARRRSPASADSNTPPMYHYQHSTRSFEMDTDRTTTRRRSSPGHSPTESAMSAGLHSPTSTNGPPSHMPGGPGPSNSGGHAAQNRARSPAGHVPNGRPSPPGNSLRSPAATEASGSGNVMSLGNIVEPHAASIGFSVGSDIDGSMLGRLNRRS